MENEQWACDVDGCIECSNVAEAMSASQEENPRKVPERNTSPDMMFVLR